LINLLLLLINIFRFAGGLMINIYDYIACPICKERLNRVEDHVECSTRGKFPITPQGIPMLFSYKRIIEVLTANTALSDS